MTTTSILITSIILTSIGCYLYIKYRCISQKSKTWTRQDWAEHISRKENK